MQISLLSELNVPVKAHDIVTSSANSPRKSPFVCSLLAFSTMLAACSTPSANSALTSAVAANTELHPYTLVRLIAGEPRRDGVPIALDLGPRNYPTTTLHYFLSEDGKSVVTRYLGPGGPSEISFILERAQIDGWQLLLCRVQWSDVLIPLARWKNEEDGQATQISVRTTPLVEWRYLPPKSSTESPDDLPQLEWRPLQNGIGVGPWRGQSRKATSHTKCSPHER